MGSVFIRIPQSSQRRFYLSTSENCKKEFPGLADNSGNRLGQRLKSTVAHKGHTRFSTAT